MKQQNDPHDYNEALRVTLEHLRKTMLRHRRQQRVRSTNYSRIQLSLFDVEEFREIEEYEIEEKPDQSASRTKDSELFLDANIFQKVDYPSRKEIRILEASSYVQRFLTRLMPKWFLEVFDESLLDDLFNLAKEEGGRIWWLRLGIAGSGFIVKFAWRRFERNRSVEQAGRHPAERDDES